MATSRHAAILVVATLAVLFIGSADAWNRHCPHGYKDCNPHKHGCETCIRNDVHNCGDCGKTCKQVAHAITQCRNGYCQKPVCEKGWGNCDHNIWNGCEKCLGNDVYNCGTCHNECKVTLKGGEATCKHGQCGQQCKKGSKLDKHKNCCVPDHH